MSLFGNKAPSLEAFREDLAKQMQIAEANARERNAAGHSAASQQQLHIARWCAGVIAEIDGFVSRSAGQ
jgi:hypothetical protein